MSVSFDFFFEELIKIDTISKNKNTPMIRRHVFAKLLHCRLKIILVKLFSLNNIVVDECEENDLSIVKTCVF